jgi:hypothetical protein
MQEFNTLKACFYYIDDGEIKPKGKEYNWHIPKNLRSENIKKGDFVSIKGIDGRKKKMIVTDVFREDIETTGKRYKPILSKAQPAVIKKDEK